MQEERNRHCPYGSNCRSLGGRFGCTKAHHVTDYEKVGVGFYYDYRGKYVCTPRYGVLSGWYNLRTDGSTVPGAIRCRRCGMQGLPSEGGRPVMCRCDNQFAERFAHQYFRVRHLTIDTTETGVNRDINFLVLRGSNPTDVYQLATHLANSLEEMGEKPLIFGDAFDMEKVNMWYGDFVDRFCPVAGQNRSALKALMNQKYINGVDPRNGYKWIIYATYADSVKPAKNSPYIKQARRDGLKVKTADMSCMYGGTTDYAAITLVILMLKCMFWDYNQQFTGSPHYRPLFGPWSVFNAHRNFAHRNMDSDNRIRYFPCKSIDDQDAFVKEMVDEVETSGFLGERGHLDYDEFEDYMQRKLSTLWKVLNFQAGDPRILAVRETVFKYKNSSYRIHLDILKQLGM